VGAGGTGAEAEALALAWQFPRVALQVSVSSARAPAQPRAAFVRSCKATRAGRRARASWRTASHAVRRAGPARSPARSTPPPHPYCCPYPCPYYILTPNLIRDRGQVAAEVRILLRADFEWHRRNGGAEAFWSLRAPRTKWTRRVPHPVLIGHAASLTPY